MIKKNFINLIYLNKNVNFEKLNLTLSLLRGQVFNWKYNEINKSYEGVIDNTYFELLYNSNNDIIYYFKSIDIDSSYLASKLLIKYFDLETDYYIYFENWKKSDLFKNNNITKYNGLRRLNQDSLSCIISFLISQNNNIKRIEKIIFDITKNYGHKIYKNYNNFPDIDILLNIKEKDLRKIGLGYRANYFVECVKYINSKGGINYFNNLPKNEIVNELIKIKGIGKKVADCIALYGFKNDNIVPIDTHMLQIYNNFTKNNKKINNNLYFEIQKFYSHKFNNYKQGLAHLFLFVNKINK